MKDTKENFTKSVHDIVTESISKVKDSIIKALREENIKLHTKCENLEAKLIELQKASIKKASIPGGTTLKLMAYL